MDTPPPTPTCLKTPILSLPPVKNHRRCRDTLSALSAIGGIPLVLDCEEHDKAVGIVASAHVVAAALVNLLSDMDGGSGAYSVCGGGISRSHQIASSDPRCWCAITKSNEKTIAQLIDR